MEKPLMGDGGELILPDSERRWQTLERHLEENLEKRL